MADIFDNASLHYAGGRVVYLEETSSTNDEARDGAYSHGDIIIAGRQTAGRGQRGNSWHSADGDNITFTIVTGPDFLPADRQFLISQVISLALVQAMSLFGIDAQIKWTNDIYVGDRKLAGVLIENDIKGSCLSKSIIGVGLNINQSDFPEHLPNPVSMKLAADMGFDRAKVLKAIMKEFWKNYALLEEGSTDVIEARYDALLYRKNEPHFFKLSDGSVIEGVIRRVASTGELFITMPDGSIKGFLFREIEFVI